MAPEGTYFLLAGLSNIGIRDGEDPRRWLGRFVESYDDPSRAFTDSDLLTAEDKVFVENWVKKSQTVVDVSESPKTRRALSKVPGVSSENNHLAVSHFASDGITRYHLLDEQKVCDRILQNPQVEARLLAWSTSKGESSNTVPHVMEKLLGRSKLEECAYMIVGFLVANTSARSRSSQHKICTKVGLGFSKPKILASHISKSNETTNSSETSYIVDDGPRIIAIEYKVLTKASSSTKQFELKPYGPRGAGMFSDESGELQKKEEDKWQTELQATEEKLVTYLSEKAARDT